MGTLRILLSTRFYKNGQTTHVTSLGVELLRQGHDVLLVISHLHDPAFSRWLRRKRIPYVTTIDPRRLLRLVSKWQPQIIHNHSAHTIAAMTALGELLQVPIITTLHYLEFEAHALLAKQDAVIFISLEMKQRFSLPIPTFVVENGVQIPRIDRQKQAWRKDALFLAQVTPEKQKNFQKMSDSLLKWGWNVNSAGNWQIKGVNHLGWVNEVWPLLRTTNLVIGTGRAVREAMASGTPAWVLGVYSDGLVTPKNVNWLEETNFSGRCSRGAFREDEAAKYLEKPVPQKMQALGTFGREHASKHYSIENMAETLCVIYEKCIAEKCRRTSKPERNPKENV